MVFLNPKSNKNAGYIIDQITTINQKQTWILGMESSFRKRVDGWNQKGIAASVGSPDIFPTGHCLTEFAESILTGHLHDGLKIMVSNVSNVVHAYPLSPLILDCCWSGCKAAPHGGSTIPKEIAEPKNLGDSPCNGWVIGAILLPSIFDRFDGNHFSGYDVGICGI